MMPALEGPQNGSSLSSSPGPILKAQPRHIVAALAYCSACRPQKICHSVPSANSFALSNWAGRPMLPWHAQLQRLSCSMQLRDQVHFCPAAMLPCD